MVLTIDRNELAARQSAGGARYHVEPDWGVDEEDARHIACDADITEFVQRALSRGARGGSPRRKDARGNLLNYGHRRRIVPARLLRALKLCGAHHRLLHHGAFHIVIEDDDVVFVGRDGEVIAPALSPQFADVPAEVPPAPIGPDIRDQTPAARHRNVLKTHSEREVIDMLHFREDWGRKKNARFQRELMKLARGT